MARKTVLVTGASRGIGKAIAIKFAKKNYNVVINCVHREERLMQTKKEIESYQVPCLAFLGDMGDLNQCEKLFEQIRKQFGTLDVLVNNAGVSYIGLLQDMKSEDWDRVIRTNLTSVFNLSKLAIPGMVSQKYGKIINISSVWGSVGAACEVAYSATKGGINAFTKALAKELAPSNIQVNAVACGAIDTEMNQFLEEEELIRLVDEIPAGRLGLAEEVADLVYHLGYKNSYLTGQIIGLDGGGSDMPTTYAHYRFGRDVYKRLPQRIQEMVRSHGGLYNIGLHGPDLLFYFKVFQKNPVNQTGFAMHDRPGKEFFEQAALVMQKKSPRRIRKNSLRQSSRAKAGKPRPSAFVSYVTSAKYAYIFGFLCHFALDSSCHPYVEHMVRETGISHSEIEAELDRDLMLHDGLNPMTCRPTPHLRARLFYGGIISRFFPDITARQILTSIRSMRLCCNLLAPSGKKLRFIARFVMKGSHLPKAVQEMVIKEQPDPKCAPITRELERRYQKAIPMAAELIVNFMEHVEEGTPLDKRFNHTFGEM